MKEAKNGDRQPKMKEAKKGTDKELMSNKLMSLYICTQWMEVAGWK